MLVHAWKANNPRFVRDYPEPLFRRRGAECVAARTCVPAWNIWAVPAPAMRRCVKWGMPVVGDWR